jgi:3-oxoacyl-[acyl-carrier-protein] synthase-1
MGAVCSAGMNVESGHAAICAGRDGLVPLSLFESGLKSPPLCGQIREDVDAVCGGAPNRTIGCALLVAEEATASILPRRGNLRVGLVAASTVAGMPRSERFYRELLRDGSRVTHAYKELRCHEPATLAAEIGRRIDAQLVLTVSTACSAGLHAVGMARRLIELGRCDICLALGADALSLLTVRGFGSLTLLAPGGCAPFDKNRAGISLGEGAGALLLASPVAAEQMAAKALAFVSGWGASADCHHMTAPHPEGRGAAAAMSAALRDADLSSDRIDFVAAHGTGTPDNDLAEVRAMRAIFGEKLPPFASMKRTIGHTLGASGTLEAVFAVSAMRAGTVPASGGFECMDEAIGAAPSQGERKVLRHILKNAFGFGGNNCSLVLTSAEERS